MEALLLPRGRSRGEIRGGKGGLRGRRIVHHLLFFLPKEGGRGGILRGQRSSSAVLSQRRKEGRMALPSLFLSNVWRREKEEGGSKVLSIVVGHERHLERRKSSLSREGEGEKVENRSFTEHASLTERKWKRGGHTKRFFSCPISGGKRGKKKIGFWPMRARQRGKESGGSGEEGRAFTPFSTLTGKKEGEVRRPLRHALREPHREEKRRES